MRLLAVALVLALAGCRGERPRVEPEADAAVVVSDTLAALASRTCTGWAATASEGVETTRGGEGGPVVTVRDADALVRAAASDRALVIRIAGVIEVDTVDVTSRKTLVGAGPGATIRGRVRIREARDVVLADLTIDGATSPDDAVLVSRAHHVWIDRCELRDARDGLLDIVHGSDRVTVSWCVMRYTDAAPAPDHRFACLVGHTDDSPEDVGRLRVTFDHVWWSDGVVERMPRVRHGQVHVASCWASSTEGEYAVRAGEGARVLVEGSLFEDVRVPHELAAETAELVARGNVYRRTKDEPQARGAAFEPPYLVALDAPDALPDLLRARAGPAR